MLVGLTGRAQHGKDTTGERFVERGFKRYGFADQLKALALYINPIVQDYADAEGPTFHLRTIVESSGWEAAKKLPEVRRFLQELGTGVRDHIGQDAWVRALELKWLGDLSPNAVITDVRFPNEAAFITRNNGILIGINRPDFESGVDPKHESERYVPALIRDARYVLLNDGDETDLRVKADQLIYKVVNDFTIGVSNGAPLGL